MDSLTSSGARPLGWQMPRSDALAAGADLNSIITFEARRLHVGADFSVDVALKPIVIRSDLSMPVLLSHLLRCKRVLSA